METVREKAVRACSLENGFGSKFLERKEEKKQRPNAKKRLNEGEKG